jgi:alpha-1,3-rhamnosyl/mannosyltransferase
LPEVVGDAALLVDPYNVDSIADAMCHILDDPTLAEQLRTRGIEQAAAFTWRRTAQDTLAIYQYVLHNTS